VVLQFLEVLLKLKILKDLCSVIPLGDRATRAKALVVLKLVFSEELILRYRIHKDRQLSIVVVANKLKVKKLFFNSF